MNVLKSTANKVLELEKRLDNELFKSDGLNVSEFKKSFENFLLDDFNEWEILTFFGNKEKVDVVLQGEIKFKILTECSVRVSLILDGYEIYNQESYFGAGEFSFSVLQTLSVVPNVNQKLILRVQKTGGDANILKYTFFVWGYGEHKTSENEGVEPKISGAFNDDRYALFLVLDNSVFVSYSSGFPENLNAESFDFFGNAKHIAPVYLTNPETLNKDLVCFVVGETGDLFMTIGESESLYTPNDVIDSGVGAVTVTNVFDLNEVVVVYSVGSEIRYFSYNGTTRTEPVTIYGFDEDVEDVALIQNCESTNFLAVSLKSGKNYLFSSATIVATSSKNSRVLLGMEAEYV